MWKTALLGFPEVSFSQLLSQKPINQLHFYKKDLPDSTSIRRYHYGPNVGFLWLRNYLMSSSRECQPYLNYYWLTQSWPKKRSSSTKSLSKIPLWCTSYLFVCSDAILKKTCYCFDANFHCYFNNFRRFSLLHFHWTIWRFGLLNLERYFSRIMLLFTYIYNNDIW